MMIFGYSRIPIVVVVPGGGDRVATHAQKAGEMVTRLGGHPSLAIGPLLETHEHDIGQILRETLQAEHVALGLYMSCSSLVAGKNVALEEYARDLIEQEEAHIDEIDKMLRKPGEVDNEQGGARLRLTRRNPHRSADRRADGHRRGAARRVDGARGSARRRARQVAAPPRLRGASTAATSRGPINPEGRARTATGTSPRSTFGAAMLATPSMRASAGEFPILMGGDHSLAIGSLAALSRFCAEPAKPLAMFWLDAHSDFNVASSSPSGNIHGMPVA